MSQYNTGTVTVTNGSAVVTGASTLFSANVTAGDFFTVVGDNAFYAVGAVDSDTQLTLAANYAGVTGGAKAYTLVGDFTTNLGFPVPNQGDIETALVVKRAIEEIDSELNTAGIGGDGREWIDLKDTPTFISATQFKIATDKTANYHLNRRIRATDSATIYGGITASSFAAGETTVTVAWDSGGLTASLTAVALGIASATAPSITGDAVVGGTMTGVSSDAPTLGAHVANKTYIDALVVSGVYWKQPVRAATTANITLSGEQTIDGVLTSADRVLVKNQTTGSENGIYVSAAGAWSRAADADSDSEVTAGIAVWVNEGTANGDNGYTLTTDNIITLDTTALTFTQFSGGGGGVSSVSATAPVTSSGGAAPDIAIAAATTSAAGSMSSADKTKLDGIATNANNYSHPNHTGDVTSAGDGATTIAANAVTLGKMADMATASLLGRNTAATGDPEVLSKATALSLLNVADGAEVNPAVVSQDDAEAGTSTAERIWTAQRVKQAIAALASGSDNVARDNIMLNAFRIAINGGLAVLNMQDGMVDEFEDETGVDTVTSTKETYDATNDLYTNAENVAVPQGDGTAIGDMTSGGGLAAAFDGATNQATSASAQSGNATTAWIGKDWGASTTRTVTQVIWYGPNNIGIHESDTTIQIRIQESSTGSWSGEEVTIGDTGTFNGSASSLVKTISCSGGTAKRYHRAYLTEGGSTQASFCAELEFSETADMTLQSEAFTAAATPTDARVVFFEEDIDAVTLNTDLKAYVSRDGGITFTQITLADEGDFATGKQILAGSVDISGQPSGSSMKWKITTHNTTALNIHGVALQWS